jgi:predicted aminopeptidase
VLTLTGLPGCYLTHLARGQARLMMASRPIERVLADPETDPELRASLTLVQQARAYAADLGLEVGDQFTSYVPWAGDRLVTSVVATRPGEIDPAGFWFPLVGTVPYKGFFDVERARSEAAGLREQGLDVCLVPVPAYSTLGWFADPVTGPLVRMGPGSLVETVIHELVHATVFASSAADFNEGVATFIGQEGALRFFQRDPGPDGEALTAERRQLADERAMAHAVSELRAEIAELYAQTPPGPERDAARAALGEQGREQLAALPLSSEAAHRRAARIALNDACLALAGTYEDDLGRYASRLEELGGDLEAFVATAREAARAPDPRAALLGGTAGGK